MKPLIMGWDIGGAHLKAALLDGEGKLLYAIQEVCCLWRGLEELHQAMTKVLVDMAPQNVLHAITMTGELADIFPDRVTGVSRIASFLSTRLPGTKCHVYAGRHGFVSLPDASKWAADIASANWHASAVTVARQVPTGVLIDVGSTTTDMVPLLAGEVISDGYSDADRLRDEELVYSGVIRTPVMAVVQKVPVGGEWVRVMAEHFATMADVYMVSGYLDARVNQAETADGAGKTVEDCMCRLARMIGRDRHEISFSGGVRLAQFIRLQHLASLQEALCRMLSRSAFSEVEVVLVGAGVGDFLVADLANRMGVRYQPVADLVMGADHTLPLSTCFSAYAVANEARYAMVGRTP